MEFSPEELKKYMERCISLAFRFPPRGIRKPLVGAIVLTENKQIIGEGFKTFIAGTSLTLHAERMAINNIKPYEKGRTLITTLEPCIELRKRKIINSSCADLIIETGIERVIFGCYDGSIGQRGVNYLRQNGVEVIQFNDADFYGLGTHYCGGKKKRPLMIGPTSPNFSRVD